MFPRALCLNAPFGARCFLTHNRSSDWDANRIRLNAPFGARCFLTGLEGELEGTTVGGS